MTKLNYKLGDIYVKSGFGFFGQPKLGIQGYSTETEFDTVAPTKSSVNFKLAYKNNGLIT